MSVVPNVHKHRSFSWGRMILSNFVGQRRPPSAAGRTINSTRSVITFYRSLPQVTHCVFFNSFIISPPREKKSDSCGCEHEKGMTVVQRFGMNERRNVWTYHHHLTFRNLFELCQRVNRALPGLERREMHRLPFSTKDKIVSSFCHNIFFVQESSPRAESDSNLVAAASTHMDDDSSGERSHFSEISDREVICRRQLSRSALTILRQPSLYNDSISNSERGLKIETNRRTRQRQNRTHSK